MSYSAFGILALIVNAIINHEILFFSRESAKSPAKKAYRGFLIAISAYFITDALWGILDDIHLMIPLYADTVIYFAAMAVSVLMWTRYVTMYLDKQNRFGRVITYFGFVIFVYEIVSIILNFFIPVLFRFDENGMYIAEPARYVGLIAQIVMFILTVVYAFTVSVKTDGSVKHRLLAIGMFGLAMSVLLIVQLFYPLMPVYSVGGLIGCCILHSFVVENEKKEYRHALEESLARERVREQELGSAKKLVYTDPMTGARSKHAYIEEVNNIDRLIEEGRAMDFSVAVFDLNGLKHINDTMGHEVGDKCIIQEYQFICEQFSRSPVYRIGGDEFAVILMSEDHKIRIDLMDAFDKRMEGNQRFGQVVVSSGIADFEPLRDKSYSEVFARADERMYERKRSLKKLNLNAKKA